MYQLNPLTEELDKHEVTAFTSITSYCIAMALSFALTLMVTPLEIGAIATCVANCIFVIRLTYFVNITANEMIKVEEFLKVKTINTAWLHVKELYCKERNIN